MKTFLEISISANEHQRELLIPTMVEFGCQGFQETETDLICYLDEAIWSGERFNTLEAELRRRLQYISANADIRFRKIPEENWNEQWEKSIRPIEIGNKLVIKPSWQEYVNPNGRIAIQIDPKMSFGTGYHETTRLMLRLLENHITNRDAVLDVGTGTGILAIAAVKLGARSAIGIDNDEWSIENARVNVNANQVNSLVNISCDTLNTLESEKFSMIVANITLNTIIEMLPEFTRLLAPTGTLLLSGFLATDRDTLQRHLELFSFVIIGHEMENEWLAVASRRRQ